MIKICNLDIRHSCGCPLTLSNIDTKKEHGHMLASPQKAMY